MARARLSLLAVLLLIVACGDEVGVPPFAARLAIEISGLPDGAAAPVTLDGPDGEAVAVSRSRVFDLLPPGEYVLRSETAALGFGNYYPDRLARTIRLDGGASRTLTVAYTGVLDRGGLRALPAGLPEDLATGDLAFAVAGPGGFAAVITPADSLDRLEPGTYQVTASRVDEGERVFAPWPETVPVEVTAGAWAVAEPAYAAAFDVSLDLQVAHVELTQAVQRDDGSVPLVAGRDAYLRVFGIATEADQVAPPVRVEWLRDGAVVASERVTRAAAGVPGDVVRDDLDASWNLPVPGSLVQAGLGVRVVIDPDGDVPEAVEANNTWPAAGDAAGFAVVARDPLPVRLVPVYQEVNGALGDVTGANAPDYVAASRQLLPTPAVDVDLHDVFTTSAPPLQADDGNRAWLRILTELTGLRAMEEHEGRHYYGVVRCTYDSGIAGLGRLPGYVAMGWDAPGSRTEVVAHELGHNLGLRHAPCGGPAGVDPDYPYVDALIGAWGFDVVGEVVHDPAVDHDLMSYCRPKWISDYMYEQVLAFAPPAEPTVPAARTTCLLVWGRLEGGRPVLDPAVVVTAAPSEPRAPGPWTLTVTGEAGEPLATTRFAMPAIGCAERGESAFAWTLPLPASKASAVARVVLDGPAGQAVTVRSAAAKAAGARPTPSLARSGDLSLRWNGAAYPLVVVRRAGSGGVVAVGRGGAALVRAEPGPLELVFSDGVRGSRIRMMAP